MSKKKDYIELYLMKKHAEEQMLNAERSSDNKRYQLFSNITKTIANKLDEEVIDYVKKTLQ